MSDKSIFAKRLSGRRIELKYTQETFSAKVGMSRPRYANYEQSRREPDFDIVKLFAENLDCTTDYLLGNDTNTKQSTKEQKKMPKDLLKILEQEDYTLNGELASPEDKEKIAKMIELMYWDAKEKNKRKK